MARNVYEMQGTIVAWGELNGEILTDDGERIHLYPRFLELFNISQNPKVGDRICFYASRRVEIQYRVEGVRMLIPSKPDHEKLRRLKQLNRALRKERNPDDVWSIEEIESFTGVVESFDRKEGGVIVADTGERVRLELFTVSDAGYISSSR